MIGLSGKFTCNEPIFDRGDRESSEAFERNDGCRYGKPCVEYVDSWSIKLADPCNNCFCAAWAHRHGDSYMLEFVIGAGSGRYIVDWSS